MSISGVPFGGGGGGGTVSSVGLVMPSAIFDVSGSPVTAAGDITVTLDTQTTKTFLAGPTSGSPAAPTFRTIATGDLGTGTANSGTYLRGDQTWATVTAGNTNGYGPVASLPATCVVGDTYTPSDRIWKYIAIATNTWQAYYMGVPITPTLAANWTYQINTSTTSTKSDTTGGMLVTKANSNGYMRMTNNTAAPAAPWTVEMGFVFNGSCAANNCTGSLMLWDGNATPANALYETWGVNMDTTYKYGNIVNSKFTGGSFTANYTVRETPSYQNIWVRIVNDNTNLNQYYSNNGVDWVLCGTHTKASFLSQIANFGIFMANENTTSLVTMNVFHYRVF